METNRTYCYKISDSIIKKYGMDIELNDLISSLNKDDKIEIIRILRKDVGFIPITSVNNHREEEFQKACYKLQESRSLLPEDVENNIIEAAKKYTHYYG